MRGLCTLISTWESKSKDIPHVISNELDFATIFWSKFSLSEIVYIQILHSKNKFDIKLTVNYSIL